MSAATGSGYPCRCWTRALTAQQINYAATDAWACRELYLKFKELGMV